MYTGPYNLRRRNRPTNKITDQTTQTTMSSSNKTDMDTDTEQTATQTTESTETLTTDIIGDNVIFHNTLLSQISINPATTSSVTDGLQTPPVFPAMADDNDQGTEQMERDDASALAANTGTTDLPTHLMNETPARSQNVSSAFESDLLQQIALLIKSNTDTLKFEIKSEIQANNDNLKFELNHLIKAEISTTNNSLRMFSEQINKQIHELTASNETLKHDLNCVKETQSQLAEKFEKLETKVEDQIVSHVNEIRDDLIKDLDRQNVTQSSQIQKITHDIQLVNQNTNTQFEQHANKLTSIQQTLVSHHEQLENLEDRLSKHPGTLPSTIQVTCSGNSISSTDQAIPKFHGRSHNPKEYLSKLKRYYERSLQNRNTPNTVEHLHEIIELSLEGHAARWFELIGGDITNWHSFQEAFEAKYWSHEVQRGIRQRMEVERYRPNGKLSRAEYFVERVLLLRSTMPPPSEEEIVICLADHFSELIQDARRVQNITTITGFEQLLQREDLKDAHNRSRTTHQATNNHRVNSVNQQLFNHRNSPPNNQQPRYNHYPNQNTYNRYPNQHNNPRNNNNNLQHNTQPNYNRNNPKSPDGYSTRNYSNQSRSPPRERHYPTHEQHQVCHTIVDRTTSGSTTPERTQNTTSLNK